MFFRDCVLPITLTHNTMTIIISVIREYLHRNVNRKCRVSVRNSGSVESEMRVSNTVTLWWSHHGPCGWCGPGMRAMCLALDHWPGDQNTGGGRHWPGCGHCRHPGTGQWLTLTHWAGGLTHRILRGSHFYVTWSTYVYFLNVCCCGKEEEANLFSFLLVGKLFLHEPVGCT